MAYHFAGTKWRTELVTPMGAILGTSHPPILGWKSAISVSHAILLVQGGLLSWSRVHTNRFLQSGLPNWSRQWRAILLVQSGLLNWSRAKHHFLHTKRLAELAITVMPFWAACHLVFSKWFTELVTPVVCWIGHASGAPFGLYKMPYWIGHAGVLPFWSCKVGYRIGHASGFPFCECRAVYWIGHANSWRRQQHLWVLYIVFWCIKNEWNVHQKSIKNQLVPKYVLFYRTILHFFDEKIKK